MNRLTLIGCFCCATTLVLAAPPTPARGVVTSGSTPQSTAAIVAEPAREGDEPVRYALVAADGHPGAFRVSLSADRAGAWRAEAVWSGRKLAALFVEDQAGKTLRRMIGPSPLTIEVPVDAAALAQGATLIVRFVPYAARGALQGTLTMHPPSEPAQAGGWDPARPGAETGIGSYPSAAGRNPVAEPAWPSGGGACLQSGAGDDAVGRALHDLAESIASPTPAEQLWLRRWVERLAGALQGEDSGRVVRGRFDTLWEDLALDPAPREPVGRRLRAVLAAVEDLVRREQQPRDRDAAIQRRAVVVSALGCL